MVAAEAVTFAIEVDGQVAGMVQFEEEADPDCPVASIDIFLTSTTYSRAGYRNRWRLSARYLPRSSATIA